MRSNSKLVRTKNLSLSQKRKRKPSLLKPYPHKVFRKLSNNLETIPNRSLSILKISKTLKMRSRKWSHQWKRIPAIKQSRFEEARIIIMTIVIKGKFSSIKYWIRSISRIYGTIMKNLLPPIFESFIQIKLFKKHLRSIA